MQQGTQEPASDEVKPRVRHFATMADDELAGLGNDLLVMFEDIVESSPLLAGWHR